MLGVDVWLRKGLATCQNVSRSTLIGSTRNSECSTQRFLNSDRPHTDVTSISLANWGWKSHSCCSLQLQQKADRPPPIYRPITFLW